MNLMILILKTIMLDNIESESNNILKNEETEVLDDRSDCDLQKHNC